jgi:hypothetical protein
LDDDFEHHRLRDLDVEGGYELDVFEEVGDGGGANDEESVRAGRRLLQEHEQCLEDHVGEARPEGSVP